MRTQNRVVLASPELRMAPLGSDNFDPNAGLRTRQYTLNQEKSGLDFGVHYRGERCRAKRTALHAGYMRG